VRLSCPGRLIQNYGTIVMPLTVLLFKEGFRWNPEDESAFWALQHALTSMPVLQLLDFSRDFTVECDGSSSGVGDVLHRGTGLIAFFSWQLMPGNSKLPYLWARLFMIKMDHFSLKYLLDRRLATIPEHQWVSKLIDLDFRVEFHSRVSNMVADTLSHRMTEDSAMAMALSAPCFQLFNDLQAEFTASVELYAMMEEVRTGHKGEHWRVGDGLILIHNKVYGPSSSLALPLLLVSAHGHDHEGTEKTLHHVHPDFFIPDARGAVRDFVRSCITCQRNKTKHLHLAGLLQPLEVPTTVWADVAMDFVERLPQVNGKSVILAVIDRFSKYCHFLPLRHPYTTTSVARFFFDNIVKLHGILSSIVSDRDPVFINNFLAGPLLTLQEINHSSAD
jgi:hypothetical protein